ncbi:MAG: hypothetical protein NC124_13475 [Clostridium sp.]|nr:hypothetical protein [Clostridium sp.]
MGTWGTGLYQNDTSADVKDDYISKLKAGKSDEEALAEILTEYKEEQEDIDCKYDFFLGLADVLWEKGRLTEEIKETALRFLEEDKEAERWDSKKSRKARIAVLDKLEKKLNSEMPPRKKVSIHKPYIMGWEKGDVYYFQIKESIAGYEQYIGWYALFYIDKIYLKDWYVRGVEDEVASTYFFLRKDRPKNAEDILESRNICFLKSDLGNRYNVHIHETSRKSRPKDLTYLGKCNKFQYPSNDISDNTCFFWSKYIYERDILWGYEFQLKYEQECKGTIDS